MRNLLPKPHHNNFCHSCNTHASHLTLRRPSREVLAHAIGKVYSLEKPLVSSSLVGVMLAWTAAVHDLRASISPGVGCVLEKAESTYHGREKREIRLATRYTRVINGLKNITYHYHIMMGDLALGRYDTLISQDLSSRSWRG